MEQIFSRTITYSTVTVDVTDAYGKLKYIPEFKVTGAISPKAIKTQLISEGKISETDSLTISKIDIHEKTFELPISKFLAAAIEYEASPEYKEIQDKKAAKKAEKDAKKAAEKA